MKLTFLIVMLMLVSCSSNVPSEIIFQDQVFEFKKEKESVGGRFDIVTYESGAKNIYLIIPHKELSSNPKFNIRDFSKLYTKTFKGQGFKFTSVGSRHIGVSFLKTVYLTVALDNSALSILLMDKGLGKSKKTIHGASDIFSELQSIKNQD